MGSQGSKTKECLHCTVTEREDTMKRGLQNDFQRCHSLLAAAREDCKAWKGPMSSRNQSVQLTVTNQARLGSVRIQQRTKETKPVLLSSLRSSAQSQNMWVFSPFETNWVSQINSWVHKPRAQGTSLRQGYKFGRC